MLMSAKVRITYNSLQFFFLQVVMIEDGEQFDRIPKIHGLLAFRQDNQSLYIRKNESWKVIAEEEKVRDLNYT